MANVDQSVSPTGSYIIRIDDDSDSGTMEFRVEHDSGGAGNVLLKLTESAVMTLFGRITRSAAQEIETSGAGNVVDFLVSSTTVASITSGGIGDFSSATGGVRLPVTTTDPNGSRTGTAGDLILFDTGTSYVLKACKGGTTWQVL